MSEQTLSRRDFMGRAWALGIMAAGGATLLSACKSGGGGEALSCNETFDLATDQVALRNTLQYVEQSTVAGQRCDNCQQWQPPAQSNTCGRCLVVPGTINPGGRCNSWVARATTPGTGVGTAG